MHLKVFSAGKTIDFEHLLNSTWGLSLLRPCFMECNFRAAPLQLVLSWDRKIWFFPVWIHLTSPSADFYAFYLLDERKLLSEVLSLCRHQQTESITSWSFLDKLNRLNFLTFLVRQCKFRFSNRQLRTLAMWSFQVHGWHRMQACLKRDDKRHRTSSFKSESYCLHSEEEDLGS